MNYNTRDKYRSNQDNRSGYSQPDHNHISDRRDNGTDIFSPNTGQRSNSSLKVAIGIIIVLAAVLIWALATRTSGNDNVNGSAMLQPEVVHDTIRLEIPTADPALQDKLSELSDSLKLIKKENISLKNNQSHKIEPLQRDNNRLRQENEKLRTAYKELLERSLTK